MTVKCVDCRFVSEPQELTAGGFPQVRCTRGVWDNDIKGPKMTFAHQYYSYGSLVRNRGPVRRHGDACTVGEPKMKGGV